MDTILLPFNTYIPFTFSFLHEWIQHETYVYHLHFSSSTNGCNTETSPLTSANNSTNNSANSSVNFSFTYIFMYIPICHTQSSSQNFQCTHIYIYICINDYINHEQKHSLFIIHFSVYQYSVRWYSCSILINYCTVLNIHIKNFTVYPISVIYITTLK